MIINFSECSCKHGGKPVSVLVSDNTKNYWLAYCRFCHKEVKADNYFELKELWNERND
jgi:hypothetical protein